MEITCEVMPHALTDLISMLHDAALPFLTTASRMSPPNSCELNMYYTAFESKIGRHRDNFEREDLDTYLQTRYPSFMKNKKGFQKADTCVMVWTMANAPMQIKLSYPPRKTGHARVDQYVSHPDFCMSAANGTLFILSPTDDLFFCHEAFFTEETQQLFGNTGYRFAFVMRWLDETSPRPLFHAHGEKRGQLKVGQEGVCTPYMIDCDAETLFSDDIDSSSHVS